MRLIRTGFFLSSFQFALVAPYESAWSPSILASGMAMALFHINYVFLSPPKSIAVLYLHFVSDTGTLVTVGQ